MKEEYLENYKLTKAKNFRMAPFRMDGLYKAALVEHLNRTLKNNMWKYCTFKNMLIWIDIVQDLVSTCNRLYHRIIKLEPFSMNIQNEMELWAKLYGHTDETVQKLKVANAVHISKIKKTFEVVYNPTG